MGGSPVQDVYLQRPRFIWTSARKKKCKVDPCTAMLYLVKEKLSHNTYLARYDVHRDSPRTDLDSFRNQCLFRKI